MAGVVDDGFIRAHGRVDAVGVGEESDSLGVELTSLKAELGFRDKMVLLDDPKKAYTFVEGLI